MIKYIHFCFIVFINVLLIKASYASNFDIPFEMINGLIVVEAEIEGNKGNFILDTGSSDLLINAKASSGSHVFSTAQGEYHVDEVAVENLVVGDIRHQKIQAFVSDLSSIEDYIDKEIKGILGSDVFSPKVLVIDFDLKRIEFLDDLPSEKSKVSQSYIDFKMIAGVPVGNLKINNNSYSFILDTGASTHFIDRNLIDREDMNYTYTGVEKNVITAFTEEKNAQQILLNQILLGDDEASQTFLAIDFSNFESAMEERIAGLLSVNSLSSKVIIDLDENRIIF